MSYAAEYQKKLVSADQAASVVKSGDWVDYGQFVTQTQEVDKALAKRVDELSDVKIRSTTRATPLAIIEADPKREVFTYNNFHYSGYDRKLQDNGLATFIPINYHEVPKFYSDGLMQVDVAIFGVTSMDEHGYFNFSTSVSFSRAVANQAIKIILEVNPNLPYCMGGDQESIHISEVDYIVEADWQRIEVPAATPSEEDRKIAELIINQIENGSVLQLGIGGMPNAVGSLIAQSDLKDLGIHTEMFVDAFVDMYESGSLTGKYKAFDKGKIVYTFAMGSSKTYDFLDHNPAAAAYSVDYVNAPERIAQHDNFIAINNAMEIDLYGQVSSESAGKRQISGTGGQLDFTMGANKSKGGKAFIALTSSYVDKEGKRHSRIKNLLDPASIITVPRSITSNVVTEYGSVNLRGQPLWSRVESLISIAHPDFREQLIQEAEALGIWRKSNKR